MRLRIKAPTRLERQHGADVVDDPARFPTTITFHEQSDGQCVLTTRQPPLTKLRREAGFGFGAVDYGRQTLDSLALYLGAGRSIVGGVARTNDL